MTFTVDKAKLKNLRKTIQTLIDTQKDYSKPLKKSAKVIILEAQDNITKQGFHYGTFRKLAPATKLDRVRKGYPGSRPILVRKGTLRKRFLVKDAGKKSIKVHNPVTYAKVHQFGTDKVPQRKILSSTSKSRNAIGIIFANYIAGKIARRLLSKR